MSKFYAITAETKSHQSSAAGSRVVQAAGQILLLLYLLRKILLDGKYV
jgi:hypothetical protein